MAALLGAQQVPGASYLQVPHGHLETGAELGELPDSTKALFGHFCEHLILLIHEVSIGKAV